MSILPKKKKLENWRFLDQNHGKNRKMSKFRLFKTSCFYNLERNFFVLKYRKCHFPFLYWLKKKVGKKAIFGPKPWVFFPLEKCQFFDFLNFLFL